MRFEYGDQWITIVIESHVMPGDGQSLKDGMDSLAQVLHATDCKLGSDYFILSGPQYENDSRETRHYKNDIFRRPSEASSPSYICPPRGT